MKILLEKYFSLHHDKVTHQVNSREINGDCYFYDNFSCQQCIPFFKRYCKHETFLLHTNSIVNAIEIEQFLNSFINLHNCERCDILLTDNHKIALIDMYCGMSEYLDDQNDFFVDYVQGFYGVMKRIKPAGTSPSRGKQLRWPPGFALMAAPTWKTPHAFNLERADPTQNASG